MRLQSIHRFPVKSMAGEVIDSVELTPDGIAGDRTWALRDTETDKLISAKRPRLYRSMLDIGATGTGDDVTVTLPGGASFGIGDDDLVEALGRFLGRPVTVEASAQPMQGQYASDWPEIEGLSLAGEIDFATNLFGEGTTFVDVGILHVITTSSLRALAAAAPESNVDLRRFRPSLVIDTADDGFVENEWEGRVLRMGDAEITIGTPAPRCVMTTVAQGDLPEDRGILQALAAHNRLTNDLGSFACLGAYASVTRPGTVEAGMTIEG